MNSELLVDLSVVDLIAGWVLILVLSAGILIDINLLFRWWGSRSTAFRDHRLQRSPFLGLDALVLAATVILAESVMLLGAEGAQVLGLASEDTIHQTTMLVEGITLPLIIFFSIALLLKRRNTTWQKAFMPCSLSAGQTVGAGLCGFLAMLPPTALFAWGASALLLRLGINVEAQPIIDILSDANQPLLVRIYLTLAALLIAPILEEIIFRGIALPGQLKQSSLTFTIVAVSAIFALIHFHLPSAPALFVIAVACSLAYLKTGSIFVPMIMHATFNGTTLLALYLQTA